MSYRVELAHEVEKLLDRMDSTTERRIRARLLLLSQDPFDPRLSSPLTQRAGVRKSRVGDWRILYTVDKDTQVIYIATVATRGQVYKRSG